MNGVHLIGDLAGCRCDSALLRDGSGVRATSLKMVKAAGLTTIADAFHQFPGGGFTGCIVLAESHLAIHTWPERQAVTLDVYVCNYNRDNSAKARRLFDRLTRLFQPVSIVRQEVKRGEVSAVARRARKARVSPRVYGGIETSEPTRTS